jgi:hypothetical protein
MAVTSFERKTDFRRWRFAGFEILDLAALQPFVSLQLGRWIADFQYLLRLLVVSSGQRAQDNDCPSKEEDPHDNRRREHRLTIRRERVSVG